MAGIDIFDIQPHQVSRDLRGYSVFFYGDPKSGKTTIATKFPKHMLVAFEKGYNAIPGAMAIPVNNWADFKKILRQLKDPKAKDRYETIIIDTADIAYDYCEKFICSNAKNPAGGFGVDSVADIPYGKGYGMVEKEFDECLRAIVQMDYGLVIISHSVDKTFVDETGAEYNQIVPTLDKRARKVVSRMTDIIGYSRTVQEGEGFATKLFIRGTPRYMAGSRFKYTPDYIDFNYQSLVNAIGEAIDKQMAEDGTEYFTDTKSNLYETAEDTPDFDELMSKFNELVNGLISNNDTEKFESYYQPRIVQITDKYLGKGNRVSQCSREQTEALSLIVDDIADLAAQK